MNLTITIYVTDDPNVSVKTQAVDVIEAQIRPALKRAQRALQAEVDALEECPYHRRALLPDTDAVCATCRWRGAHAPDCPRKTEPWPTIGGARG